MLRRAHWGRPVPAGIGLGNLRENISVKHNTLSTTLKTHEPGGIVFVQLETYSDQLIANA